MPISSTAIHVTLGAGEARLRAENVAVPDFHDFPNAVSPSPTSIPAHVSFDVHWTGADRKKIRDPTFGFAGDYVVCDSTIDFSASDDGAGVVYTSDPGGQKTIGGGIGLERNGVFFH